MPRTQSRFGKLRLEFAGKRFNNGKMKRIHLIILKRPVLSLVDDTKGQAPASGRNFTFAKKVKQLDSPNPGLARFINALHDILRANVIRRNQR